MSSADFLGTDRFAIRRRLGAGGMGVVYEAYDRVWQQNIALKTLVRTDPSAIYRLKTEFRSLADVAHPNLVCLYELVIENDLCFFTMELIDGVDLIRYVRNPNDLTTEATPLQSGATQASADQIETLTLAAGVDSSLSTGRMKLGARLERLRPALRQLAEGLCALHDANKLHRDIKPSNTMVTTNGRVVILDFGLTTELTSSNPLHTLKFAGTPAYMSPEQGLDRQLTSASDWYSVGVTLFQCLTGSLPFADSDVVQLMRMKQTVEAVSPSERVDGIPADLESLCCDLLRRDPESRPSGREVLQRLGASPTESARFEQAIGEGRRMPFVGRDRHLSELKDAFAASKTGQTVSVYIHGSSGMGKSSLVRRFLEDLRRGEKAIVLEGRCYERESLPYKALDGIIDSLSRCLRSMPRHEAAALMPRDVHALSRLFPVLLRVEAVAEAPYRFEKTPDPLSLRSRACAALRELFARIFDRQPLVLFVDDLQWADADSMALLEEFLRPPGEPSLLLVVSFRSEEARSTLFLKTFLERVGQDNCRELTVGPLTGAESCQLVEAILEPGVLPAKQSVPDIVREGAGSPFFLEQLARWTLANTGAAGALSINLDEMLNGQIAPLPAGAQALLETLAVAATPLDVEVACQAAGLGTGTRPLITALRVAHLIRSTGVMHRLEIYHDRIREHLAARIEPSAAQQIHRNLANALESNRMDDSEALFEHTFRGAEPERAAGYAVLAAQKSASALAFDRAAMFYRHALDLASTTAPELVALKAGLAEALANAGRPAEAAHVYLDAVREASPSQALDFQRRAAEQLLVGGHIDEGRKAIQNVLSSFGLRLANGPRRALFSFLVRRFQLWLRGLKFTERDASEIPPDQILRIDICWAVAVGLSMVDSIRSSDFQTRHLLLALQAGEPYRIARATAMEAGFSALPGGAGVKRSARYLELAEKLSKKVDHPHAIGLTTLLAGVCAFLVGKWREAARLCEQAQQILRDKCTGVSWELTSADTFLLGSLMYLGEYALISQSFVRLLATAQERGNLYASTELRTRMNFMWLVQDGPDRARKELAEAMQSWSHEGFHRQHYNCLLAQAHIELYTGNMAAAYELVERQWRELERAMLLRIQVLRIEAYFLKARTILAAAGTDRQFLHRLPLAEKLAARISREEMVWSDGFVPLIRSGIANLRGNARQAAGFLTEAEEKFKAADMKHFALTARRQLGLLSGSAEGGRLVVEADAWMTGQGIRNPERFTNMWAPGFSTPADPGKWAREVSRRTAAG